MRCDVNRITDCLFQGRRVRSAHRCIGLLFAERHLGIVVSTNSSQLADFVVKNRLPAISPFRRFADAGGLMSYGPDFDDFRLRSASYVDKVLKGAKPSDLPIQQPEKFELVINLKTAKALGLTIPQSLLQRADEVIQ